LWGVIEVFLRQNTGGDTNCGLAPGLTRLRKESCRKRILRRCRSPHSMVGLGDARNERPEFLYPFGAGKERIFTLHAPKCEKVEGSELLS